MLPSVVAIGCVYHHHPWKIAEQHRHIRSAFGKIDMYSVISFHVEWVCNPWAVAESVGDDKRPSVLVVKAIRCIPVRSGGIDLDVYIPPHTFERLW